MSSLSLPKLSEDLWQAKKQRDLRTLVSSSLLIQDQHATELQQKMRQDFSNEGWLEKAVSLVPRPADRLPLGKYFESLLYAGLKVSYPESQLYRNIQDGSGGELDFLLTSDETSFHIECAVKFYIYRHELNPSLASFWGPKGKDRLDLKLKKMRDVQLKRSIPDSVFAGENLKRVLWMSGALFCHDNESLPEGLLRGHQINSGLKGFWMSSTNGNLDLNLDWYILPKHWWITSLDQWSAEHMELFEKWNESPRSFENPVMIVGGYRVSHYWNEVKRVLMVPPSL